MSSTILLVDIPENFKLEDIEKEIVYNNLEGLDENEVIEDLKYLTEELKKHGQIDRDDSTYFGILLNIFQESKLNLVKKRIDIGGWESAIVDISSILKEEKN